jgi:AcrR family transcriptional regulator
LRHFEPLLAEGRAQRHAELQAPSPSTEPVLLAGIAALVAERRRAEHAPRLDDLVEPLCEVALAPYLGAKGARQAVRLTVERYAHLRLARQGAGTHRPLQAGKHRMPSAEVAADQRHRALLAAAELLAERGAASVTVARVVSRARISRATFYENFASIGDCLRVANEDALRRLWAAAAEAAEPQAEWSGSVRAAIAAALAFFAAEPSAVYLLGVAGRAADPEIAAAHAEAVDRLAALLRRGRAHLTQPAELSEAAEPILIASLATLLESFLVRGDPAGLPQLEAQLTELLLAPYLGAEQARRAASG